MNFYLSYFSSIIITLLTILLTHNMHYSNSNQTPMRLFFFFIILNHKVFNPDIARNILGTRSIKSITTNNPIA